MIESEYIHAKRLRHWTGAFVKHMLESYWTRQGKSDFLTETTSNSLGKLILCVLFVLCVSALLEKTDNAIENICVSITAKNSIEQTTNEKAKNPCAHLAGCKWETVSDNNQVRARTSVNSTKPLRRNTNKKKIRTTHSIPLYSWNMLKVLRLVTNNRRNFSLFQLNKLFKQAATHQRILHSTEPGETVSTTMSTPETNGTSPQTIPPTSTPQTQNLDGIVKFLELLGNLKVSELSFYWTFHS